MEHAGAAVANEVDRVLLRRKKSVATRLRQQKGCVVCVCGKGNNGGDGFVAARHLMYQGARVALFLTAQARDLKGDALLNHRIVTKMGASVRPLRRKKDFTGLRRALKSADAVVDALLGIGASGIVRDPVAGAIRFINASGASVVSVDVPSGLDALTGQCLGDCVRASRTVTFTALKTGLVRGQGPRMAGRIRVVDIGIPRLSGFRVQGTGYSFE
jgi:NAD(P)H-hydrate epimerase